MLHALDELALQQSRDTGQSTEAVLHFLSCGTTHPGAEKVCKPSKMMLTGDSDAIHTHTHRQAGGLSTVWETGVAACQVAQLLRRQR